jgi:hypothetical protein
MTFTAHIRLRRDWPTWKLRLVQLQLATGCGEQAVQPWPAVWLGIYWSHALGTGTNDGDTLATYQPWRIWNYGPPAFDQRQILTLTYVWDLPRASKTDAEPGSQVCFG